MRESHRGDLVGAPRRIARSLLAGSLLAPLVAIATVGLTPTPAAAACTDTAAAGVDWSSCPLSFAQLNGADLRDARLAGANLSYAALFQTNLAGADLRRANLKDAFPVGADLSGANLTAASLIDADLVGANLTNARFVGADFTGADVDFATLTGADFTAARLEGADFADASGVEAAVFGRAPVGTTDVAAVLANGSITLSLLANDDPSDTNPFATMRVEVLTGPSHGSFDPGTGIYRPAVGYVGRDSFTYRPVDRLDWATVPSGATTTFVGAATQVTIRVVRPVVLPAPYAGSSGDRAQIARLYAAVFNRAPDQAGFDYWLGRYRSGTALEQVAASFLQSGEFFDAAGNQSDEMFVDLVYMTVFGRAADSTGRAFWVNELASGMERSRLVVLFANAPEFLTLTGTS